MGQQGMPPNADQRLVPMVRSWRSLTPTVHVQRTPYWARPRRSPGFFARVSFGFFKRPVILERPQLPQLYRLLADWRSGHTRTKLYAVREQQYSGEGRPAPDAVLVSLRGARSARGWLRHA